MGPLRPCPRCGHPGGLIFCPNCHTAPKPGMSVEALAFSVIWTVLTIVVLVHVLT